MAEKLEEGWYWVRWKNALSAEWELAWIYFRRLAGQHEWRVETASDGYNPAAEYEIGPPHPPAQGRRRMSKCYKHGGSVCPDCIDEEVEKLSEPEPTPDLTTLEREVGPMLRCIEEAEYQRLLRIIEKQTDLILQLNERIPLDPQEPV